MNSIELPRTTLVQDRDGLCVKINARPDDPGVRISAQQLDNWCVKQYRENIMKLMEAVDEFIPLPERPIDGDFLMPVEDVFSIEGRGTVATGRI